MASLREKSLMTFARGNIRGYDDDRMVLLFSMMDDGREVPCAVSAAAMDELEHVPRTPADRREEQFSRLRDRIEACASRKFEKREFEGSPPGILVRGIDFRTCRHCRPADVTVNRSGPRTGEKPVPPLPRSCFKVPNYFQRGRLHELADELGRMG